MSAIKRISIWIAIAIPPICFYALLARTLTDLPMMDDYNALLKFMVRWKMQSGIQHFVQIVTSQHNEYRLMFAHALIGAQYAIFGRVHFAVLAMLGNLLIIPLFVVLYLIWRDCGRPREYTLLGLIPASWILFQLQFEGTLNYSETALSIIPATLFAVLACYLAARPDKGAFLGSLLSLLLCIGSNGNGLFLVPVGALMFLQRREFKRLAAWCGVSAFATLVYFYGYDFTVHASHSHTNNDVVGVMSHVSPVFGLAFLGNIATVLNPWPAVAFGAVLVAVFIWATYDRLYKRRPALYYSALFFVVTGAAVSGLRASWGLEWALNSTYRLDSTVLVILLYLFVADKLYGVSVRPIALRSFVCIFALLLVAFNVESDRGGNKVLKLKRYRAETEMSLWVRHEPRPPMSALTPDDLTAGREKSEEFWPDSSGTTLADSIREGIYELPPLPAGK